MKATLLAGVLGIVSAASVAIAQDAVPRPAGWIGTQNASGIIQLNVIASGPPLTQNFGLYNGS